MQTHGRWTLAMKLAMIGIVLGGLGILLSTLAPLLG